MSKRKLFTSESVTEGHPDKICDQVSDAILDAIFTQDPMARVACECANTTGLMFVTGEITTSCYVDIPKVVRQTIKDIGYTDPAIGFDGDTCGLITAINEQSPDIAQGVNAALETRDSRQSDAELDKIGAGDQGMVFGFAVNETPEYMPLPIALAHRITKRLAQARKSGEIPYLRPDGKAQVTVEYIGNKPHRIDAIVVSTQHKPEATQEQIREDVINKIIRAVVPENLLHVEKDTTFYINPTGKFVIGGPQGDAGLTGRKIIVDSYGGMGRHGGGAFSGKDPTKVDRSGAYAARHVAKNIVAAGFASRCEVQISYAIGVARPVSLAVDTFGTGTIPEDVIIELITRNFDLRPAGIIQALNLRRPIYRQTAAYGHFGRDDLDVPWEKLDKVDALKKDAETLLAKA